MLTLSGVSSQITGLLHDFFDDDMNNKTDIPTFDEFVALNISNQTLLSHIDVCNNCNCCCRHTGNPSHPDLPAIPKFVWESQQDTACTCKCRHLRRLFQRAIDIN
jgi:hypothetical protein